MTHDTGDVAELLNGLIEICMDGEHGYRTAAGDVGDPALASVFTQYAEQRAKFVKELHAEVIRLGGSPVAAGSVTGAVHRGWINVKSALAGSVIASCETGEESAVAAYDRAVDSNISGITRALVERQAQQVREALSHIKRLENSQRSTI